MFYCVELITELVCWTRAVCDDLIGVIGRMGGLPSTFE